MLSKPPKIVAFDLETIPNLREALTVWPQLSNYPGQTLKASINSIVCFGWKILGEPEAQVISAWDFPSWLHDVNDDRELLRFAFDVLKDADVVITQNGKAFDEKVLQTRLLLHGMDTLPKLNHVDTKLLAKKFSFFSNSLKYLSSQLSPERQKIENEGWNLWVRVHSREAEACEEMARYCKGDVEALEAIYRKLRIASSGANALPNHNLLQVQGMKEVCPHCGSTRSIRFGVRYTATYSYQRYQCCDCRSYFRTDMQNKNPRAI